MTGMNKQTIRISVRGLVEFVLRSGDIDSRAGTGMQQEAMQAGSRMHRKIQKSMGTSYEPEVFLKTVVDMGRYFMSVEGRADGVITRLRDDGAADVVIDEIKTMYSDVMKLEAPAEVHRAQAMCYAYIYGTQHALPEVSVQMTYCSLETEEIRRFQETFLLEDLAEWFDGILQSYRKWTDFQYDWGQIRRKSVKGLDFPFPYRSGQKELVKDVYRTILREKQLFLQAPTGAGKTMAVLFPAVKATGEDLADRIFYLTAKGVTGTAAMDAAQILMDRGYRGKVIRLTAKEKMCPLEHMECNPDACPRAKGHFDRVNDAVYELLLSEDCFDLAALEKQAQKWKVCPFEFMLDLSVWCDLIICDYNYVFDPNVYLKRFFADGIAGNPIFLVDEAHNLVERGRGMYSAVLVKEELQRLRRRVRGETKLCSALDACCRQLLEWKRACSTVMTLETIGPFQFQVMRVYGLLETFLKEHREYPDREEIAEDFFTLRHFLNMAELTGEQYVIYTDYDEEGRFLLHLYCVDPSENLQRCLDRARSTVFFSATFLPVRYYRSCLSAREDDYAVYADTSFSPEQHLLYIARDVSTLYRRRTSAEYQRIAAYISRTVEGKSGNYMVFLPSYRMMEEVGNAFRHLTEESGQAVRCVFQDPGMDEGKRRQFLEEFDGNHSQTLVGFCVLGGIFGEGIDLTKDRLIGVLIAGTGLPQICTEREVLREYYDKKNGKGFAYAYLYPGMNKVLQAAGRVIRTAEDRGVIGLLDERFLRREYQELFPREWSRWEAADTKKLPEILDSFWQKTQ
jgi:DNA excision repair protein ERCC-2